MATCDQLDIDNFLLSGKAPSIEEYQEPLPVRLQGSEERDARPLPLVQVVLVVADVRAVQKLLEVIDGKAFYKRLGALYGLHALATAGATLALLLTLVPKAAPKSET